MDTKALFKIGYGLYVLTTNYDNKDNGCIINTVQQVTDNPLRLSIVVNKTTTRTTSFLTRACLTSMC